MYNLSIVTKARGKVVASYSSQFKSALKFMAFDRLTPHRMAIILDENNKVDTIYELSDVGVPIEVTDQYDVEVF